jgi:hypothetical protein
MDDGLRNKLWNVIREWFLPNIPPFQGAQRGDTLFLLPIKPFFERLNHGFFKTPVDNLPVSYFRAVTELRNEFLRMDWFRVYDLLEFLLAEVRDNVGRQEGLTRKLNATLKEETAGYQIISGHVVQITDEAEITAIEIALNQPDSLKTVREHLNRALGLLADRTKPDYRNSIKESISSVEALAKIIAGLPKTTLGPALDAVGKKTPIHPSLKGAFQKLYDYTSDAQGIRHALMDEPNLDIEDAKFMLVSCSGFVNYLVLKAQKAQIAI